MTTTAARPTVRLYAKRPTDRRWQLVGEYPTRDAAWNATAAVPKGHAVWLNDQPQPAKETTMLQDRTARFPLPPITSEELSRIRDRFTAVGRVVAPMLRQVDEVGKRVFAEQMQKLGAEFDRASAVAAEVFTAQVAELETAAADTTE